MTWRRLLASAGALAWFAGELLAFEWLSGLIGWPWVIAVLAAQFAIGVSVARYAGMSAFRRLAEASRSGDLPGGQVGESALVALGGGLIAVPTLLTDIPGLLLLAPPTRRIARRIGGAVVGRRITAAGFSTTTATTAEGVTVTRLHEGSVVEGEVVESHLVEGKIDEGRQGPEGETTD